MSESSSSSEGWPECDSAEEALRIFYETLFGFAEIIVKLCKDEEALHPGKYEGKLHPSSKIIVIKGLLELFDKEQLCKHYVNYVLTWKEKIEARNDSFFLENDHIYPGAPKDDVEFFRDLWRPKSTFHLSPIEKESVYEYFDTMLHFCSEWKRLAGFTAVWDLTPLVHEMGEDVAYDYIMRTYDIEEFEDFGYHSWDEFLAKHMPDSYNQD